MSDNVDKLEGYVLCPWQFVELTPTVFVPPINEKTFAPNYDPNKQVDPKFFGTISFQSNDGG